MPRGRYEILEREEKSAREYKRKSKIWSRYLKKGDRKANRRNKLRE
jgi:hypothetical protein